ncbi:hypothetical protein ES703_118338 [subsurface metagenome]
MAIRIDRSGIRGGAAERFQRRNTNRHDRRQTERYHMHLKQHPQQEQHRYNYQSHSTEHDQGSFLKTTFKFITTLTMVVEDDPVLKITRKIQK